MRIIDIEKYMVRFYNEISGSEIERVEDMPAPAFNTIKYLPHVELVRPFVCKDLLKGRSRISLIEKYNLTEHQVRQIGRDLGHYAKWTR